MIMEIDMFGPAERDLWNENVHQAAWWFHANGYPHDYIQDFFEGWIIPCVLEFTV